MASFTFGASHSTAKHLYYA